MFVHEEKLYNTNAALEVAPYINGLFNPSSILDVGCGTGTWLKVFSQFPNIKKFTGIDGHYVDKKNLIISQERFFSFDLNQTFDLKEKFDLVISLEVAEHLEEKSADTFIKSLTKHSDIIVFSAAIPGQGGQDHINEKWPEYWREKFSTLGYDVYDIFRKKFWENEKVEWWYRQNMFAYIRRGFSAGQLYNTETKIFSYVHPELLKAKEEYMCGLMKETESRNENTGIKKSLINLGKAVKRKLKL